jgi:hypothetical protein
VYGSAHINLRFAFMLLHPQSPVLENYDEYHSGGNVVQFSYVAVPPTAQRDVMKG